MNYMKSKVFAGFAGAVAALAVFAVLAMSANAQDKAPIRIGPQTDPWDRAYHTQGSPGCQGFFPSTQTLTCRSGCAGNVPSVPTYSDPT